MTGTIFGNIVGSRFTSNNCRSKEFELFHKDCFYSLESTLTVAVADALLKVGEKDDTAFRSEALRSVRTLGNKFPGGGRHTAFVAWYIFNDDKPYQKDGNGAAVRISPVGWYAKSEEDVGRLSRIVTSVLHDDPEAFKGAECIAMCVYLAKNGATKEEIFARAKAYYPELGSYSCAELSKSYTLNWSCQGTVPEALTCFFGGESFEDTIRNAIFIGGDSDTIAAIAGSVAEAYFGMSEAERLSALAVLPEELQDIVKKFEGAVL